MIIHNLNTQNVSNRQQVLAQAQTIMNFFSEAVEQNECNVKVVMGFQSEIQDTINSINDIDNAFNQPIYNPDYWKDIQFKEFKFDPVEDTVTPLEDLQTSPAVIEEAKKALKERCFNCRFGLPIFSMSFDKDFLYNKLDIQITLYKKIFKSNLDFNLCKASFMFQRTCVPDMVKLIAMFLSAFAAILALQKLPRISLGLFVKAIIGQLMAKVVASLRLSIDMTSTGIPCVISALREVAHTIPTNEAMKTRLNQEQWNTLFPPQDPKYAHVKTWNPWDRDYRPVSEVTRDINRKVKDKEMSQQEADKFLENYKKKNDTVNYYADKLEEEFNRVQEEIDEGLQMITGVVDKAVADVNSYIDGILGVINFLQCENKRTGSDFTEIIEYVNNIQKVINLCSAITVYIVKQILRWQFCEDAKSLKDLRKAVTEAPIPDLTTPGAISEIVQEYSGQRVKLDADGLNLLIYEEPVETVLPKLTLTGCNFQEFAASHTLDNIIKRVATVIDEERRERREQGQENEDPQNMDYTPNRPPSDKVQVPNKATPSNDYEWIQVDPFVRAPDDPRDPFRDPLTGLIRDPETTPPGNTGPANPNVPEDPSNVRTNPTDPNPVFGVGTPLLQDPRDPFNSSTGPSLSVPTPPELPEPVEVIPVAPSSGVGGGVYRDWVESIDELIDLIYNPPIETSKGEGASVEPATNLNPFLDPDDPFNNIQIQREELVEQQTRYQPSLAECKNLEDVMDLLNNIKL